jgi:hypothetical protein
LASTRLSVSVRGHVCRASAPVSDATCKACRGPACGCCTPARGCALAPADVCRTCGVKALELGAPPRRPPFVSVGPPTRPTRHAPHAQTWTTPQTCSCTRVSVTAAAAALAGWRARARCCARTYHVQALLRPLPTAGCETRSRCSTRTPALPRRVCTHTPAPAGGATLAQAFEQAGLALFNYMTPINALAPDERCTRCVCRGARVPLCLCVRV